MFRRLVVFLPLFLSACAFVNLSIFPPPSPPTEHVVEGEGAKKILLFDISGFISSKAKGGPIGPRTDAVTSRIREQLRLAGKDPDVVGVILRIDSPGGTVTASDMVYHEILRFRKQRPIPVYAVILNVGTSGAYYIASAADRILAHPTSVTGSIGVIAVQFNLAGLLEKIGVAGKVVKSVPLKDIYSPFRADTPEEKAILQDLIDGLHQRFVEVVAAGRAAARLEADEVRRLADGRPYSAAQALDAGLIDDIGYLDDAIDKMKENLGLEKARVIIYDAPRTRHGSIYAADPPPGTGSTTINLVNVDLGALAEPPGVDFLYLWSP